MLNNLVILLSFFLVGCKSFIFQNNKVVEFYDDALIESIQNAENKIEIDYDELPLAVKDVVSLSYASDVSLSEIYAFELGYELTLNSTESGSFLFKKIYFDLEGIKLKSKKDKDEITGYGLDCFQFVYPLSFIMQDQSIIMVESYNEEDWEQLKSWYNDNLMSQDFPELQYPVSIIGQDGLLSSVINDQEMEVVKLSCD